MVKSLAEIRAKLQEQEAKKKQGKDGYASDGVFPIWNIPENSTTVVRLLPDKDETNDYFWRERLMIRLPFPGVKGQSTKRTEVQVPCVEMFGRKCPIKEEIAPWWKDDSMKELARVYYRKPSYVYQGFIVSTALEEQKAPENPIRRFVFGPAIHKIIKDALMDPEFENMPTDFEDGVDFKINKTTKGDYADYSSSAWARRARPLTEDELGAIEKHGLYDLKQFLPKEPTDKELEVIFEMFEASVGNEPYDPDRFGKYFRPFGLDMKNTNTDKEETAETEEKPTRVAVSKPVAKPVVEEDEETAPSSNASSVLAKLKAKQQPAKAEEEQAEAEAKPASVAEAKPQAKSAESVLAQLRAKQAAKSGK